MGEPRLGPAARAGRTDGREQPARRPGGAFGLLGGAAVLVIFGAIAAIGLVKSGGRRPRAIGHAGPRRDDRHHGRRRRRGEGEAVGPPVEAVHLGWEDQTTTTTAGAQAPAVGECAVLDVAPEPDEVHPGRPCDAPTAAVQLSQVVPSPAPPGEPLPQGTDTVAQVTADASVGRAAPELWCLRNGGAPSR